MPEETQVAAKPPSAAALLKKEIESMAVQFKDALPLHIPVERFVRVCWTAIITDPNLLDAVTKDPKSKISLYQAALEAAQDGLLPNGDIVGHCGHQPALR